MIEILEFRLAAGRDEEEFSAVDQRVQVEFAYQQPGLLRRTTAKDGRGGWVVIDLWATAEAADACDARWGQDDLTQEFMSYVEPGTLRTTRYWERE